MEFKHIVIKSYSYFMELKIALCNVIIICGQPTLCEIRFKCASQEAQIEIEIPTSDWDKEYSWYVNQQYSSNYVNIYILFIYSLFYLYPREYGFTMGSLFQ